MTEKTKLDLWLNDQHFEGEVSVNTDTLEVDLGDLAIDGYVYYDGCRLCSINKALEAAALYNLGLNDDIYCCYESGIIGFDDDMVFVEDRNVFVFASLCTEFEDKYYLLRDCSERTLRNTWCQSYRLAPDWWWDDLYYCESCGCYVYESDYHGNDLCEFCYEKAPRIIKGYCESHDNDPVYFGDYKGEFCGLGVELEVDCDYSQKHQNEEVASNLCSHCGLEYNEVRFAEDGSLENGFENIIEAHTVKDFWAKQDKWMKMLKYLSDNGYKSHDTSTCGLHVHVSRTMFGKTEEEQTTAIAKVFVFFDENWDEIVKVSRRKNFRWSGRNGIYKDDNKSNYENWKKEAKEKNGGHDVALNNSNRNTFEYRLGRGTLNTWSFFSWIDFILTISKNAKRITVKKIQSNDLVSWFSGIKESTAKYIYKRGAFRETMLALFPNIEWETDLVEIQ